MANALQDVVETFLTLDAEYNVLRLACRTQTDRNTLDERYATAQENNEDCTNQLLKDDDAEVANLSKELKGCNEELKRAEIEMGDMSKVLDNLTRAVAIGSELIAKIP